MTAVIWTGGDAVRSTPALFLCSEIVLPLVVSVLAAYKTSPTSDPLRSLILTANLAGRRVYLERFAYILAGYTLFSLAFNLFWLAAGALFSGAPLGDALLVTIFALPIALLFSALALRAAEALNSPAGGAALSSGVWLVFILLTFLSSPPLWEPVYPFLCFYNPVSKNMGINRMLLLLVGVLLLIPYAGVWFHRARYCGEKAPFSMVFLLPVAAGLACGFFHGGSQRLFLKPPETRDESWRQDLHFLKTELERQHIDVFHTTSSHVFRAAVADLDSQIPVMNTSGGFF